MNLLQARRILVKQGRLTKRYRTFRTRPLIQLWNDVEGLISPEPTEEEREKLWAEFLNSVGVRGENRTLPLTLAYSRQNLRELNRVAEWVGQQAQQNTAGE